jgi:hypothetical protein
MWVPDNWQINWTQHHVVPQNQSVELHLAVTYPDRTCPTINIHNSYIAAANGTCSGVWYVYNSAEYILVNNLMSLSAANNYCNKTYGATGIVSTVSTFALVNAAEQRFLAMVLNNTGFSATSGTLLDGNGVINYQSLPLTAHGINFTEYNFTTSSTAASAGTCVAQFKYSSHYSLLQPSCACAHRHTLGR